MICSSSQNGTSLDVIANNVVDIELLRKERFQHSVDFTSSLILLEENLQSLAKQLFSLTKWIRGVRIQGVKTLLKRYSLLDIDLGSYEFSV